MRKMLTSFVLLSLVASPTLVFSQANPRGKITSGDVAIEYGRPSAKGRNVMGLISPGTYWRMGADDSTTLTTQTKLGLGDAVLPEGTYFLLAHFTEKGSWELIVCKEVERGFRPKDIVAVTPLHVAEGQSHVEQLTIDLKDQDKSYKFVLSWGFNRLTAAFSKST